MPSSRDEGGVVINIKLAEHLVYTGDFGTGDLYGGEKTVGREVFRAH